MPGNKSLEAQQYYGNRQNSFWPIMAEIFGFDRDMAYEKKLQKLLDNKVGLWDVLASCEREGSLDSDIKMVSVEVNDFQTLLSVRPNIKFIFFNGRKAQDIFTRKVTAKVFQERSIALNYLPSTSPANASLNYAKKLFCWEQAFKLANLGASV